MRNEILSLRAWNISDLNEGNYRPFYIRPQTFLDSDANTFRFKTSNSPITYPLEEVLLYPDKWIVERSTGLPDINGKEIYEGDIVKRSFTFGPRRKGDMSEYIEKVHGPILEKIIFEPGNFMCVFIQGKGFIYRGERRLLFDIKDHNLEVYSNIHEYELEELLLPSRDEIIHTIRHLIPDKETVLEAARVKELTYNYGKDEILLYYPLDGTGEPEIRFNGSEIK